MAKEYTGILGLPAPEGLGALILAAYLFLPVVPPAELSLEGAGHVLVLLSAFSNGDVHAIAHAWGLGDVVVPGEVDMAATALGTASAGRSFARGDGFAVGLDTLAAGPPSEAPEGRVRCFAVKDQKLWAPGTLPTRPIRWSTRDRRPSSRKVRRGGWRRVRGSGWRLRPGNTPCPTRSCRCRAPRR